MTVLHHEKAARHHVAGKAEAHRDIDKSNSMWLGLAPHLAVAVGHDCAGQPNPATSMLPVHPSKCMCPEEREFLTAHN